MAAATDPAWLDGGRMLPLVEDFYTIQGRGIHAGKPAYFIRLGGCDVGCRWCDAKYTWNPKLYPPTDVQTVIDRAMSCPAQAIVITGGEPLLYPLGVLTENAARRGLQIFLETSGSHPFSGVFDWVLSLAEAPAAAPGRGVRTGRRTESDRRVGGGFRMGRAECRPRRRKVPAVPPARVERRRKGHARNSRVRQGASAMEYLHSDAQIHAYTVKRSNRMISRLVRCRSLSFAACGVRCKSDPIPAFPRRGDGVGFGRLAADNSLNEIQFGHQVLDRPQRRYRCLHGVRRGAQRPACREDQAADQRPDTRAELLFGEDRTGQHPARTAEIRRLPRRGRPGRITTCRGTTNTMYIIRE